MGGRRGGDCIAGWVQGQHSRGRAEAGAICGGLCGAARGAPAGGGWFRSEGGAGRFRGEGIAGGGFRGEGGTGMLAGFAARGSQAGRIVGGGSLHLGLNSCRD
jgi:hypothetical protein